MEQPPRKKSKQTTLLGILGKQLPSTANQDDNSLADTPGTSAKKVQRPRVSTVKKWGLDYLGWEEDDDGLIGLLWCKVCRAFPEVSTRSLHDGQRRIVDSEAYIKGTKVVKKVNAVQHATNSGHQNALRAKKAQEQGVEGSSIARAVTRMDDATTGRICKLFDIAYSLAYMERPFSQFPMAISVEKKHEVDLGHSYANPMACASFTLEIDSYMCDKLKQDLSGQYFGLSFDGSTDKAAHEKEVVTVRFVSPQGTIDERILSVQHITFADAASITECIRASCGRFDLDIAKNLVAASADGASVNFGAINGVMTRMRETSPHLIPIHCSAHKLELAVKDAFKNTYFSQVIDEHLMRVYYFYEKSKKRFRELKMVGDRMNGKVVKPPRACGTRWVAHRLAALKAMQTNYPAIIMHMEDQASGERRDINSTEVGRVKGYLNKIKTVQFIYHSAIYRSVLECLSRLSLCLQTQGKTVSDVQLEVEVALAQISTLKNLSDEEMTNGADVTIEDTTDGTTVKYQGVVLSTGKSSFQQATSAFLKSSRSALGSIHECLGNRFKDFVESEVLGAMSIIDPANWPHERESLHAYGQEEMQVLLDHFEQLLIANDCDIESVLPEWQKLKLDIRKNHAQLQYDNLWQHILTEKADRYSNVIHVIKIILCIPIASAHVERIFSAVKRILGDRRLTLNAATMEALVRISMEGVDPVNFDPLPVVKRWRVSGCYIRRPNIKPYGPRKEHANTTKDANDLGTDFVDLESDDDNSLLVGGECGSEEDWSDDDGGLPSHVGEASDSEV